MTEERLFLEDASIEGQLQARLLRSPSANGVLAGIKAPKLPHSFNLFTAADIPGSNVLDGFNSKTPVFASDRLSYAGQPVAILVGPDKTALDRLASLCVVETKEEPPRFSFEKFSSDQLAAKRTSVVGDPDEAFEKAARVVELTSRTGTQLHWCPEPHGALARFAYDKLEVQVATQWPFHVRRAVAAVLAVKAEDVVVEAREVAAHLDGRLWYPSLVACWAALAAFLCRKPVKLTMTRTEDALYAPRRPPVAVRHRAALGEAGELLAIESKSVVDVGSGGPFAEETLDRLCLGSLGAYRCPNVRIEGFAVRTNNPPTGPLAGVGLSQAFFAAENLATAAAAASGSDPGEWRRANALSRGDKLSSGAVVKEAVPSAELLDAVMSMSDFRRKWASNELVRSSRGDSSSARKSGALRGIGLAFAYQGNGFLSAGADKGHFSVELTLEKDGGLEIRSSAISGSRENAALWKRLAAEKLGIDIDDVRFAAVRTDAVPDSGPSSLSRNVAVVSLLIGRCCDAVRKQRFRDPLPITVKRSYRPPRQGDADGNPFAQFSWAAAVVEAEIDPSTYEPRVRGVWIAVDGGRILSERKARSSLEKGCLHALGWAYRENPPLRADEASASASDIFAPSECPPVRVEFSWNEAGYPKGIGELPFACVPSAFAQALAQATASNFSALPVTVEAIREALEEA